MAEGDDIISRVADLYNAFMDEKYSEVRRLCLAHPEDILRKISIYNDTALHMAAHSKRTDLVLGLLQILQVDADRQLSDIKNADGNTILHEVATSDAMKDAADELLKRNMELLTARNELGEKPIFCAARYGQTQMFKFLAGKMELEKLSPEESKAHLQRIDGTTVLHVSVAAECFELALSIVECYPYLIEERDQYSVTALQYLACNPIAFRRWKIQIRRGFIELLINSKIEEKQGVKDFFTQIYHLCFGVNESDERFALQALVGHLVKNSSSWNMSIINSHFMGPSEEAAKIEDKKSNESPLFLATTSDIEEIVREVIDYKPEALKDTNKDGMNILHVAILYRHTDIFDMVVEKYEVLARRLLSAKDNRGNSVLHMVSQKRKSRASEKMQSPALQLRNELLLFEKVKSACKMLVTNPLNKDNKTAEELFSTANEQLHQEAKEWLMRTTENCTILSVFIATVAFAAIYTVPGGPDQNTGIPIFHSKPFFLVFTLADVISLTLALTSVGIFLSILTSSFPLQDFKKYLFRKLIQGILCLVLSVSMMAVAFGATVVLIMIHHGKHVIWSVVGFLPVPIFFLSYSPLRSAVLGPCRAWFETSIVWFLVAVVILVMLLYFLLRLIFNKALKACLFIICKPLSSIFGINFTPKSDTEPSHPTSPPPSYSCMKVEETESGTSTV